MRRSDCLVMGSLDLRSLMTHLHFGRDMDSAKANLRNYYCKASSNKSLTQLYGLYRQHGLDFHRLCLCLLQLDARQWATFATVCLELRLSMRKSWQDVSPVSSLKIHSGCSAISGICKVP